MMLPGCPRPAEPPVAVEVQAPVLSDALAMEARLSTLSHADLPDGAPSVVVHAPAGIRADQLDLVVYLHGWEGCARAIASADPIECGDRTPAAPGWGVAALHDAAQVPSVLVIPQLAWRKQTGNAGRFKEDGFGDLWLEALVDEVLAPALQAETTVRSITLVAHSGGYVTALAMLEHSDLPITDVVLLDALYGGANVLSDWATDVPGRRVVTLHTPHPDTRGQSRQVAAAVGEAYGQVAVAVDPADLSEAIRMKTAVCAATPANHGAVPREHLTQILTALSGPRSAVENHW